MPVSVNYTITFTCLKGKFTIFAQTFSESVLLCSEKSAKILTVN